jgi:plasmid stability protein
MSNLQQIVIRLPPELIAELQVRAAADGRSFSSLVRVVLARWAAEEQAACTATPGLRRVYEAYLANQRIADRDDGPSR